MDNYDKKPGTFKMGRCTVIVAIEADLWHLSISTPHAQPSYKEIKEARYRFIPDEVTMAQLFPPKSEFVNLHPYCHHLWQTEISHIPEEKDPAKDKTRRKYEKS